MDTTMYKIVGSRSKRGADEKNAEGSAVQHAQYSADIYLKL